MEYQALLPFDEYLQRLFLPALRECSTSDHYDAQTTRLVLFETLRWLELGVDLRVFSNDAGRVLISEYNAALAEQYRLYPKEYYYHLPDLTHMHLHKITSSRELSRDRGFEVPELLSKHFQGLLEMVARINVEQTALSIGTALLFLREAEWKQLLSTPITGERIMDAMSGAQNLWLDGHRAYVFGGFFKNLVHLEEMLECLDYQQRADQLHAGDWSTLRQTVREIHGWRFNFQNGVIRQRFQNLSTFLGEVMTTQLSGIGVTIDKTGLDHYVNDLMDRWHALGQPLIRTATS